jgi:hypothetical protein
MHHAQTARELCRIALLAVLITVSALFKLPSILPGMEFVFSAPVAVAICGVFGIKAYLLAGLVSSTVGLLLGTQGIFNVSIAMLFRVAVAVVYFLTGPNRFFYLFSGPIGTFAARICMSFFVGKAAWGLVAAAVPGMIFTLLTAGFCAKVLQIARSAIEGRPPLPAVETETTRRR